MMSLRLKGKTLTTIIILKGKSTAPTETDRKKGLKKKTNQLMGIGKQYWSITVAGASLYSGGLRERQEQSLMWSLWAMKNRNTADREGGSGLKDGYIGKRNNLCDCGKARVIKKPRQKQLT